MNRNERKLVYLASPYTSKDIRECYSREAKATVAAGLLIEKGYSVFAPITQSHRIATLSSTINSNDHDMWMECDLAILKHCQQVVVLAIPGYKESKGVAEEVAFANENGIPVAYATLELTKAGKYTIIGIGEAKGVL